MGAEPSMLSPWASVFCFWVVPCNPVSEDILECFSCSRSPRCCCFELLGDMALRLDTGHFWLVWSRWGLEYTSLFKHPDGGGEDTGVGRGGQRVARTSLIPPMTGSLAVLCSLLILYREPSCLKLISCVCVSIRSSFSRRSFCHHGSF